jgi:hypothetical protein
MSKARKASTANGNDPRQKLTGDFVTALQADWQLHGPDIIEALRTQNPVKYAEIVTAWPCRTPRRRLTTSANAGPNWKSARSS